MEEKKNKILDTAVIMAGGQGTRLAEVTRELPKPMVNIRGTDALYHGMAKDTILEYQIDRLSENGIKNFILIVGYKKEFIENAFTNEIINKNIPGRNIKISYFEEERPLGTAGSFCTKELQEIIGNKEFLFGYSDVLFDVNIQEMYAFHKKKGADATVLVSPCADPHDRPLCVLRPKTTEVVGLVSKQGKGEGKREGLFSNTPKNGFMILGSSFFKVLPEEPTYLDMEEFVLSKMIYNPAYCVQAWNTPCYIKDIGVVERFREGVRELEDGLPAKLNPAKNSQGCVVFKQSDLFQIKDEQMFSGKAVALDERYAHAITLFNKAGAIVALIKDIEELNKIGVENEIIDTMLCNEGNGAYVNTKINDMEELNELSEEWNIAPQKTFLFEKTEGGECLVTTLDGSKNKSVQPTANGAVYYALNKIENIQVQE